MSDDDSDGKARVKQPLEHQIVGEQYVYQQPIEFELKHERKGG